MFGVHDFINANIEAHKINVYQKQQRQQSYERSCNPNNADPCKNKINSDPRSHHFRPGAYQQECRQRFTPRRFRTEGHTNDYYCADLLNTGSYSAY